MYVPWHFIETLFMMLQLHFLFFANVLLPYRSA